MRVRFAERTSVRSDDARPVASIEVKPLDRAARSIRRTGCGSGRGVDPLGDSIRKGSSQRLRYFSCEREGVHERVREGSSWTELSGIMLHPRAAIGAKNCERPFRRPALSLMLCL